MKLFLTSAGLSNNTLVKAFNNLVGIPPKKVNIAFVPTAANIEEGDKGWLINDYYNLKKVGYAVDIVDISAITRDVWLPRLKSANVLFFGGGNTFHLMHWIKKSGIQKMLPDLLRTRVYAGISAGSCIAGPTIYNSVQNLFGEKYSLKIERGLGFTNFQFIPHLNSKWLPKIRKGNLEIAARGLKETVYALDDKCAIKIVDGNLELVGDGKHYVFNDK